MEHHGDTPVMYFYHKALQEADGQAVDIADFRYDGRRPQSKESAIIMLADTVEAAVRSMHDPTPRRSASSSPSSCAASSTTASWTTRR